MKIKKQIGRVAGRFLAVLALLAAVLTVAGPAIGAEADPTVSADAVEAHAGDTVSVRITVADNPGLIALRLQLSYDADALTLTAVKDGGLLGKTTHSESTTALPFVLFWNNPVAMTDYQENGTLATLTFKVNPEARSGSYPIGIDCGDTDAINAELDPVVFTIKEGTVSVICDHPRATWQIQKKATCLEGGTEALTCADCGKVLKTRETALGKHSVASWTVDAEATLTETGKRHGTCTVCGEPVEETIAKRQTSVNVRSTDGNDAHENEKDQKPAADITVEAQGEESLPGDAVLTVKDMTEMISPEEKHHWNDAISGMAPGKTLAAVYQFAMILDEQPYQPTSPVKVTVKPDKALYARYSEWQIVQLNGEEVALMASSLTEDGIVFETADLNVRYGLIGVRRKDGLFGGWIWLGIAIVLIAGSAVVVYSLYRKKLIFKERGKGQHEK